MSNKTYELWTPLKSAINDTAERLFFHEREIWYCHIGENVGFEQDGRGELFLRPVVIIRKFNNDIFWGIPLTRTHKNLPFYFKFRLQTEDGESAEDSSALLTQIRLIDAKRLRRHIGHVSTADMQELKKKLKALIP